MLTECWNVAGAEEAGGVGGGGGLPQTHDGEVRGRRQDRADECAEATHEAAGPQARHRTAHRREKKDADRREGGRVGPGQAGRTARQVPTNDHR